MAPRPRPPDCRAAPNDPSPLAAPVRERLVAIFRALGDPTRFEVFRLIAAQEAPICACDVVGRFDLAQPTISYHLRLLREAGLVTASQRGVWAYYAADPEGLRLLEEAGALVAAPRAAVPA